MTQFKDKAAKAGADAANVGLFTYPILMAADILLYQADKVPVGEDQRQHLELTRDLAVRFNARYGETFTVPEPHILRSVGKIQDLADPTSKMSKSAISPAGLINLLDEPRVNVKKIKSAVTDSERTIAFDLEHKPGVSNLLTILSALSDVPVEQLVADFEGKGYGDLKGAVADAVTAFAAPYRERTQQLLDRALRAGGGPGRRRRAGARRGLEDGDRRVREGRPAARPLASPPQRNRQNG